MKDIKIFDTLDNLSSEVGLVFVQLASDAISRRGQFSVALSGGSTPRAIYRLIASSYADALDWKKVFFFFGDERNVPPDSPESNFRMANEELFFALPLHQDCVRPWPTWHDVPEKVAEDYSLEIESFFGGSPRFDLVLLGLGADCHTASLFPHTRALNEYEEIAVANWVDKLDDYRFTLTPPVINNAANIMFIVAGRDKAAAVTLVLEGDQRPDEFPAQLVNPTDGNLRWMLDNDAGSLLKEVER